MSPLRGVLVIALLVGCSSNGGSGARDGNGGNGAGGSAGGAGFTNEPVCEAPGYANPVASQRVSSFRATVTDLAGTPLAGLLAQVCGTDICVNAETEADGSVFVTPNADIHKPAFKYGDGVSHVKLAQLLGPEGDYDLGTVTTAALPPLATAAALEPGSSVSSGGVTLELASDLNADIDPFDFVTDEERGFRAVEIPIEDAPAAIDPVLGFELIFGTTPAGALLCPAAKMSVPNSPAWAAGTEVEFFVHGTDIEERLTPYGGWAKVSGGAVSADGSAIETSELEGIPMLSVIGIRRKL